VRDEDNCEASLEDIEVGAKAPGTRDEVGGKEDRLRRHRVRTNDRSAAVAADTLPL
jgi:hypothetical protein